MKSKPLVSVIVSIYNSEKFIDGKIQDLITQTIFDQTEVIFINSGSLQNEEDIIIKYLDKYSNFKYIKTSQRESIYKAWNRGIKLASGEFVTNANTDDRLKNNAFEILSNYLLTNPDIALVYADQIKSTIENERFSEIKKHRRIRFPDFKINFLLERCIIGSQPMWRSSLHFKDNLWFDENYEVCGDHDFELKVATKYKIFHLDEPLGVFYKSPRMGNKEYENLERNLREVRRIQEMHTPIFINNLDNDELNQLKGFYSKYLYIPLPILFLIKIGMKIINVSYPKYFFHSVGFIYYVNIILLRRLNKNENAIRLAKRYLKYKKSELIYNAVNMKLLA